MKSLSEPEVAVLSDYSFLTLKHVAHIAVTAAVRRHILQFEAPGFLSSVSMTKIIFYFLLATPNPTSPR